MRIVTSELLAHVTQDMRPHLLRDHLESVGDWAASLAPREDLSAPLRAAGRWHDLGKYTRDFQYRIRFENGFEAHLEKDGALERGHSTPGARCRLEQPAPSLAGAHQPLTEGGPSAYASRRAMAAARVYRDRRKRMSSIPSEDRWPSA